jgi:hypothetical protein
LAWYPLATKLPIQPGSNDPPITPIGAILHVDAGNSGNLFNYFNGPSKGIESHFHIPKAGPIQQYRDTHYEADANAKANSFLVNGKRVGFVSIETQGLGRGEWNEHQLTHIKTLLKWLAETHNFPLQVCKSSTSPGVGYHVMWGAPGAWTPYAKDCPGPDRVRQFHQVLVPWFKAGAPLGAVKVDGGNVVTPEQMQELKNYFEARIKAYAAFIVKNRQQTTEKDLKRIQADLDAIEAEVKEDQA